MALTKSTPSTTTPSKIPSKTTTSKTSSSSTTTTTSSTKTFSSGTSNNRSLSNSPTPKAVTTTTTTSSCNVTKITSNAGKTSSSLPSATKPVATTTTSKVSSSSKPSSLSSSPKATFISKTSSALRTKTGSTTTSSSTTKAPPVSKQQPANVPVKPKTPLPKAQQLEDELNRLVCKLPSEVLLIILDYYGGLFDQSCGSNVRKFNQLYFGKFTRSGQGDSPKFLFRRLELDGSKMYHRSELLRMTQCLAANGAKIAMKVPYVKLLHDTTVTDSQQALTQTKKTLKLLPVQNITSLNVRQLPSEVLVSTLEVMAPYLEDVTILQVPSSDMCEMNRFCKLKFPKLRIFRWRGHSAGKDEDFTEFSANSSLLTTLDIQTSVTSIFRFSKALKNWPNIRTVKSILKGENGGSLHGYTTLYDSPPDDTQREFFENLSSCSKLSTISLDHEKIKPGMLKYLAGMPIKTAEITSCGIGDSFSELLTIASLKKLKLGTYEAVHEVSTDVMCDLVDLNIFRTPIFSVERLSQLKNLKTLTLINQDINDKFVEAISKELPLLETIDLSENPITNNSILSISKNCPKITSIRAINTGVSNFTLPKEIKYLVVK
ncbi:predicted protein [Naegleria gruberi]|uniref:Predicted protein n=1 Tax=Naegleria gruberi TaxID=5762 RepID=D2VJ13_NAEGR|nr:uncharacterized protein NAEGRDRAFT_49938 [Naegleria gruberi]EFC43195.1 predicted protein [Naegleria gruberi]|eukprot:XP_002675939.1 predicted protein [Naegleria gruberi strain NEG-M]